MLIYVARGGEKNRTLKGGGKKVIAVTASLGFSSYLVIKFKLHNGDNGKNIYGITDCIACAGLYCNRCFYRC